MDHDELVRLYGPWRTRTPRDAAELLDGYSGRWWIAGGWAIETFTGVRRLHDDLDPSIPRSDVPALRQHLSGRLDVWQAADGALRPMTDPAERLMPSCGNLWLRPDGASPWEYDVTLMHATSTTWTYKRDARIHMPLDDVLWVHDDISYLRPEVQLLHKAPGLREKDQADFDTCLHLLEPERRAWLKTAVGIAHPGHPWLNSL